MYLTLITLYFGLSLGLILIPPPIRNSRPNIHRSAHLHRPPTNDLFLIGGEEAELFKLICVVKELGSLLREAWVRQDGEEYWKVDVAIAVQNLILAATEEGLGTCWIGDFNEKEAKKALGVPKDVRVVAMMPLGYPDEESAVSLRKPLCEIVCYNQWLASEGEFYVVKAHTRFLKRTAARGKTLLNRLK